MLTIKFENPPDIINYRLLLKHYGKEIRVSLVKEIIKGIREDLDEVTFLIIEPHGKDFTCNKSEYLNNLEENLPKLEEVEEYELCAVIRDLLGIRN